MLKIEMVRCKITSPFPQGDNPEGKDSQVRFIPYEIYRLWNFLMTDVKSFSIIDEKISFWVDHEQYSKDKNSYGKHKKEEVTRIYFRYFKNIHRGRPVIRYFPDGYLNKIMRFFMKNFSMNHIEDDVEEVKGYFITLL